MKGCGDVNINLSARKSRIPHEGSGIINLQEATNEVANGLIARDLSKLEGKVRKISLHQTHIEWFSKGTKGSRPRFKQEGMNTPSPQFF